jgi:hydrogenase/urease accessory protein HupE
MNNPLIYAFLVFYMGGVVLHAAETRVGSRQDLKWVLRLLGGACISVAVGITTGLVGVSSSKPR